jgi:hypothetical protein
MIYGDSAGQREVMGRSAHAAFLDDAGASLGLRSSRGASAFLGGEGGM